MLCNVVLEGLWAILTSPFLCLVPYFRLIASPGGQEGHSAIILLDFGVDNLAIDLLFDAVWPWAVFVLCYSRVFCHRVTSQNRYAVGFIGNIIARIWCQAKWDFWKKCWYYWVFRWHSWRGSPWQGLWGAFEEILQQVRNPCKYWVFAKMKRGSVFAEPLFYFIQILQRYHTFEDRNMRIRLYPCQYLAAYK